MLAAVVVLVVGALISAGASSLGRPRPHADRVAASHARRAPRDRSVVHHARRPLGLGVYLGPGDVTGAESLDHALGGRVTYAMDFVSEQSWSAIADPAWLTDAWGPSPFHMVIGVPMLPATGATLGVGATGAYDATFASLATQLVAHGLATAVLLIGWQPEDLGQPWYVGTVAAAHAYVAYWDEIHATMAAVPGARFRFEWDPGDAGASPLSPAEMYPGNAAVDVVATDAFDTLPTGVEVSTRFSYVADRGFGPSWMATFAASHHKPMAIAMWGLAPPSAGGAGDDPAFVVHLVAWAARAGVTSCVLWDYGAWSLTGGAYPAAAAALARALGATSSAPPPRPSPST